MSITSVASSSSAGFNQQIQTTAQSGTTQQTGKPHRPHTGVVPTTVPPANGVQPAQSNPSPFIKPGTFA